MVTDEFRPDVGKDLFVQHQAELERALQQAAAALGLDQTYPCSADFFQAFISGFWDPFEEICTTGNRQQEGITAELRTLEHQLCQELPPDKWETFNRYGDLLSERNSAALDYAFLVGYQCAFRFLLMGIRPATGAFLPKTGRLSAIQSRDSSPQAGRTNGAQKIYTHDEAALILELFENLLAAYAVRLPSPEDNQREADNSAALYGSVYADLLDTVESRLIDLLNRCQRGEEVVRNAYSGNT